MSVFDPFKREKTESRPTAVQTLVVERAVAVGPEVPAPEPAAVHKEGVLEKFLALADRVGYSGYQLNALRFEKFLHEQEIFIYPFQAVWDFLDHEAKGRSKGWAWHPVRRRDALHYTQPRRQSPPEPSNLYITLDFGGLTTSVYSRPVPFHALEMIERIESAKSPLPVHFYINDFIQPTRAGDPFLMVTGSDMPEYIVHHWDEPGFDMLTLFEKSKAE
jgi:hypothetical protein